MKYLKISIYCLLAIIACGMLYAQRNQTVNNKNIINPYYSRTNHQVIHVSNEKWKEVLNPDLYAVARLNATEPPFSGKYNDFSGLGTYYCAACGNGLFKSDAKFSTTCGWPSFFETLRKDAVIYKADKSVNMSRIEVKCGRCDAHLGHVFDDGPAPTGKRYCMNSISLEFEPDNK